MHCITININIYTQMFRQVNNLVSKYKQDGHLVFLNVLHVYMFIDV